MYSIDRVVLSLKEAVKFESDHTLPLQPVSNFEGKFREKIEARVQKWRIRSPYLVFESPKYVGTYEIGHFTGNKVVQVFTNVLNNEKLCRDGNCVLFSFESVYCIAFVFITPSIVEAITPAPPREVEEYKHVFSKLFDDDSVNDQRKRNKNYSHLYTEDKIRKLRLSAKSQFPQFLNVKLKNFPPLPFRSSFLGILFEIGKSQRASSSVCYEIQAVPVAACIKLAQDVLDTGRLNRVFGEIISDKIYTEKKTWGPLKLRLQEKCPHDRDEKKKISLEYKASLRMNAAKEIVKKAIPSTKNGMFREEDVKKVIAEIKAFYQIEEQTINLCT